MVEKIRFDETRSNNWQVNRQTAGLFLFFSPNIPSVLGRQDNNNRGPFIKFLSGPRLQKHPQTN